MNTMYLRKVAGDEQYAYQVRNEMGALGDWHTAEVVGAIWLKRLAKSHGVTAICATNSGAYHQGKQIAGELAVAFFAPLG
ncbi:MAG: hypothetical protein WCG26_01105 [Chloroflexales bacterium]